MNLVLVRGLPGSGKSTLAEEFVKLGYQHFEADQFFVKDGTYSFDRTKIMDAHRWCQKQTETYLKSGQNVVVANTFTRISEMQFYIDLANRVGANLYVVKATGEYDNSHGCPMETVSKMRQRWEKV